MADRILGLLGPGRGPSVYTRNLGTNPKAKVSGLRVGGFVMVMLQDEDEQTMAAIKLETNGFHEIAAAPYMVVESDDKGSPNVICTFHST